MHIIQQFNTIITLTIRRCVFKYYLIKMSDTLHPVLERKIP